MYSIIKIGTLLLLVLAAVLLMVWLFRPGSKEKYIENSKIALKNDKALLIKKKRKKGNGKRKK
jgi:cbb3-type cytochrome oxidase subunit 3